MEGLEIMATAKIVFASLTGNNEEIAGIVEEAFEDLSVEVSMTEISQADVADFEDVDICVVVTYTYGEGDLPDEAVDFYEDLQEINLAGKVFGVCGSGDTFYDSFAQSVTDFDAAFEKTGATRGAEVVKIDLAPDGDAINTLETFTHDLVDAANK